MFAACSDDETVSNTPSPDGGSTGGSNAGTGGRGTGGRATGGGGASTGGRATGGGGANTGGSTADGGGAGGATGDAGGAGGTDGGDGSAGDSSVGTGGTGTGGAAAGGAGGANTGGAATDGGSCSTLSACCSTFTGRRRTACQNIANAGNAANCTAVEEVFCGDGGVVGPGNDGGGADAFVNCAGLQTCCDAFPDGGRRNRQCERVVANANDATCNQVAALFCN